jgi:hypothetical protein
MRAALVVFPLAALAATLPLAAQNAASDPAAILAATRVALGGDKKLTSVKAFVATGRTQQVRGDNLVPIEFEIAVELPDKYVRKDEIPARESGPTSLGFSGDSLIQVPPQAAPPGRVVGVKQDFARLALGMFATSFPGYPLTFSYIGQAEAPQGKADVLEAKGAPNFAVRLFIDQTTHLPIMLSWQGGGENRIYFADFRDVDGLKWPFRLRRALGADTVEETTFDRYRVNPRIDPKKFQP